MEPIEDRIQAGIWGVLVGDALGVPHEFTAHPPGEVDMVMPPEFKKRFAKVPYGTWSDDGSLTLALADSLADCGRFDAEDYGKKLVAWYTKGAYTPDGVTFDIGNTTQEAVLRMLRGHAALNAGLTAENANGNGSLMRVLPLALFHKGSEDDLFRDAGLSSQITHGHPWSKGACGLYCVAARHILNGHPPTKAFILGYHASTRAGIKIPPLGTPRGSGFVLDSLSYAIMAARSGCSYEEAVLHAIALGNDTDTTAAIAGGLVGTRDGMSVIPARWMEKMQGRDVASKIIQRLLEARRAA